MSKMSRINIPGFKLNHQTPRGEPRRPSYLKMLARHKKPLTALPSQVKAVCTSCMSWYQKIPSPKVNPTGRCLVCKAPTSRLVPLPDVLKPWGFIDPQFDEFAANGRAFNCESCLKKKIHAYHGSWPVFGCRCTEAYAKLRYEGLSRAAAEERIPKRHLRALTQCRLCCFEQYPYIYGVGDPPKKEEAPPAPAAKPKVVRRDGRGEPVYDESAHIRQAEANELARQEQVIEQRLRDRRRAEERERVIAERAAQHNSIPDPAELTEEDVVRVLVSQLPDEDTPDSPTETLDQMTAQWRSRAYGYADAARAVQTRRYVPGTTARNLTRQEQLIEQQGIADEWRVEPGDLVYNAVTWGNTAPPLSNDEYEAAIRRVLEVAGVDQIDPTIGRR